MEASIKKLQTLVSPALDKQFLIDAVKRKTNWSNIEITDLILDQSEGKKGDSYLSTIARFKIVARGGKEEKVTVPVITKAIPLNQARRLTFRSSDFFPNEINFYEKVWAPLVEFIKSKNVPEKLEEILPLYLGACTKGSSTFLALEDVSFSGYSGIDRSKGLNFEQAKSIVECFAKFHAISYAYKLQSKEGFKKMGDSLFETYFHEKFWGWYKNFQTNLVGRVRECVVAQLGEGYATAFDNATKKNDFFGKISQLCAEQGEYAVVSHGDAWIPNFLVKYGGDGQITKTLMIDFQLARISSLGLDLGFFFYTCTDETLWEDKFKNFLEVYCDTFRKYVRMLGSDASELTADMVWNEIQRAGYFCVGMSLEGLIMSLMDEEDVADIDGLQVNNNIYTKTRYLLFTMAQPRDAENQSITIPVITKGIPENPARRKTFRFVDFYENEINFYEKFWSELVAFVKSKNLSESLEEIVPIYLGGCIDGWNSFIALEDASVEGFVTIDRSKKLTEAQTKSLVECFAKFHAISYAFKLQSKEKFAELGKYLHETYFHERLRNWYVRFQAKMIEIVRDCVIAQLDKTYLKIYDDTTKNSDFYGEICRICKEQGVYSVLTHGDAWVPNFLVKYGTDTEINKMLLIDFQLARIGSMGQDLGFFFYTCTDKSMWEGCFNNLLKSYCETFQKYVSYLGQDATEVTPELVLKEIKNSGPYCVGITLEGLVMSLMEDEDVPDIDSLEGEEAVPLETVWILKPFTDQAKQKRVADVIKHAIDNKFIP